MRLGKSLRLKVKEFGMEMTKESPGLGARVRRLFEIQCDCCGGAYDADLSNAMSLENDRLVWLCPTCGCPSGAVRRDVANAINTIHSPTFNRQ
jgi:Zn finger protein HypA/HybF involved in hydrogenase expression